ncbi:MAG: YecA family protein [Burkholderiaceae bacterium]
MKHAVLNDAELEELQRLLDAVPAPLEPLDASMLDGFLCGVLVQPAAVPSTHWLQLVTDIDGRLLPPGFEAARLHELVKQRHAQLDRAIGRREWFDPWVFELADAASVGAVEGVFPWVAGFAAAMNAFPALLSGPTHALTEPLALLYRHLAADDLEDADELLEVVATLAPLTDMNEAVEDLVRATLLLADVGRPLLRASVPRAGPGRARRPAPTGQRSTHRR